jgi:hypothetical protein
MSLFYFISTSHDPYNMSAQKHYHFDAELPNMLITYGISSIGLTEIWSESDATLPPLHFI